jgi:hypothetical protein
MCRVTCRDEIDFSKHNEEFQQTHYKLKHIDIPEYKLHTCRFEIKTSSLLENSKSNSKIRGLYNVDKIEEDQFIGWYYGELMEGNDQNHHDHSYCFETPYADPSDSDGESYYFKNACINALSQDGQTILCPLAYVNHSQKRSNLDWDYIPTKEAPLGIGIAFFAKCDIPAGTELLFDYGHRYHEKLLRSGNLIE